MQTQLLVTLSEEKRAFFLALLAELDFVEEVQEVRPADIKEDAFSTGSITPLPDFSEKPLTDEEYAKMPKGELHISESTPEESETYETELAELHDDKYSEESESFGDAERVAMIKKMKFVPPRDYSKFPPTPEELAARPGSIDVPPLTEEEKLTYEAEIEELLGEYPDEPPYTNYDNGIETGAKRENEQ